MMRFSTFHLVPLPPLSRIWSINRHWKTSQEKRNGSSTVNKDYIDLNAIGWDGLKELCVSRKQKIHDCNLQVFGTGSSEVIPSFQISCLGEKYVFNCGEGLVRLKGAFKKVSVVLFTQASWENVEGCLSFCKNFKSDLIYAGPSKCAPFADTVSKFSDTFVLKPVEDSGRYFDGKIRISVIDLKVSFDEQCVVAYSCKLSDDLGKFNAEKAAELGVPCGPAYRLLLGGRSVITQSGNLVHPSQVVGEPNLGPSFLVVDCPHKYSLEAICSHHKLEPEWFKEKGEKVKLIVHITPLHILQTEQYSKWMASFGVGVDHLLLHASVCPGEVSLRTAMSFSMPFHLMNPEVYHFPRIPNENKLCLKEMNVMKYLKEDSLIIGQVGLKYNLKSKVAVDLSETLEPLNKYLKNNYNSLRSFPNLHSQIKTYHSSIPWDKKELARYPMPAPSLEHSNDCMVTFLGTSSSRHSEIRGMSGILLQTIEDGNLLFDCGVGTLQQLHRCFGNRKTDDILRNLRTIFISHMHPDHCFGIFSLLSALKECRSTSDPVVTIIGPEAIFNILRKWNIHVGDSIQKLDFIGIMSHNLVQDSHQQMKLNLRTVRVNHIDSSYAVILSRGKDWKIVYSGDTSPCHHLVNQGKDATLLIHEGTFSDMHVDRARRFRHCTFSDVIDVSKRMNAEHTIVTHFSTRFTLQSLQWNWAAGMIPAVDLMSVKLSDLHKHKLDSEKSRNVFRSIVQWVII